MPIVNSYIHKTFTKPNDRQAVYEEHVDHLGVVHCHRYYCPADHNTAQALIDWAAGFDARMAIEEGERIFEFIREGGDPADISVDYLTNLQLATAVVKGAMASDSPKTILPTVQYIDANITNTQLSNWFGSVIATKIRARIDAIMANELFLASDSSAEL